MGHGEEGGEREQQSPKSSTEKTQRRNLLEESMQRTKGLGCPLQKPDEALQPKDCLQETKGGAKVLFTSMLMHVVGVFPEPDLGLALKGQERARGGAS